MVCRKNRGAGFSSRGARRTAYGGQTEPLCEDARDVAEDLRNGVRRGGGIDTRAGDVRRRAYSQVRSVCRIA